MRIRCANLMLRHCDIAPTRCRNASQSDAGPPRSCSVAQRKLPRHTNASPRQRDATAPTGYCTHATLHQLDTATLCQCDPAIAAKAMLPERDAVPTRWCCLAVPTRCCNARQFNIATLQRCANLRLRCGPTTMPQRRTTVTMRRCINAAST